MEHSGNPIPIPCLTMEAVDLLPYGIPLLPYKLCHLPTLPLLYLPRTEPTHAYPMYRSLTPRIYATSYPQLALEVIWQRYDDFWGSGIPRPP